MYFYNKLLYAFIICLKYHNYRLIIHSVNWAELLQYDTHMWYFVDETVDVLTLTVMTCVSTAASQKRQLCRFCSLFRKVILILTFGVNSNKLQILSYSLQPHLKSFETNLFVFLHVFHRVNLKYLRNCVDIS